MQTIIQFLLTVGGQSIAEISEYTGYSKSYVYSACSALLYANILVREKEGKHYVYAAPKTVAGKSNRKTSKDILFASRYGQIKQSLQ